MKIDATKSQYHRFSWRFEYAPDRIAFARVLKDSLGYKDFGYLDDENGKRWVFSKLDIIKAIKERFPDVELDTDLVAQYPEFSSFLLTEYEKEEINTDLQSATESNITIPGLKGQLYPYQKVGVEFFIRNNGNAILADVPGTGKTAQTLGYILASGQERSLIVCPASVKFAWASEVKKWTKLKSVVIDSKTDLSKIPHDVEIWIINYDILIKHLPQLLKTRFTFMAGDEAHMLKNQKAKRTKAFIAISRTVKSVGLLTGTPMLSRPVELFTLLHITDPAVWNNWFAYTMKYCAGYQGRWGYDASGSSNIDDLKKKISKYFLRRTKDEVLKELPPKIFIHTPVEMEASYRKQYDAAEKDLRTFLRDFKGKKDPEVKKIMQAEKLVKINVLRSLSSMGKLPAAIELIQNIVDGGEKVLVFSSFTEPLSLLKEKFGDSAVMITGQTPQQDRGDIVGAFQNDPSVRIFLGGIKSAGVGITLTAGSSVVFLDYSWNPADMVQAQDRVHRPGQAARSINIYQMTAEGTIDDFMLDLLNDKQKLFEQLIEKGVPQLPDESLTVLDNVFKLLENNA